MTASDFRDWLKGLGLEKYGETLASHDIDLAIAPELTDQDLEKLGLSLGHRRKFLAAAAKLRGAPAPASAPAATSSRTRQVERRQVTVVFMDLVGSTALASQLDPEDMGKLLHGYREACTAVIARYDGHIAQYLGDGILAYFGYPQAQEDAAERAVRAALDMIREVSRQARPDGVPLQARAGIATGLVATSEMAGQGADGAQTVIGATPNLAARLQALAEPGAVLVSEPTHRLTRSFFEYLFMGEHALKGYEDAVGAWRALSESSIESRFVAARAAGAEPILGRERELALLADAWKRATAGNGHLVLVSGDPGIGKSKLIEAFAARLEDASARLLRCQCSPHHANSALHPFIQLLRRRLDIRSDVPAAENLRRIDEMLARIGRASRVPRLLIAELLEIPSQDALSPMEMTRAQRKNETLAILEEFLVARFGSTGVLLLIEDAHWSDPTTQSLIARLLQRVEREHALVLVTQRPELDTAWASHPNATLMICKPLAREHCAEMVRRITTSARMDDEVVRRIVARSDGVPLYVEEIAKAVIDMGLAQPQNVPLTLQDSLSARLDRLGKAKDVAQVASVIGRHFSHALLAELTGERGAPLDEALARLKASGLVLGGGSEEHASYSFNHALVQDAAYASVARDRRQALHARIARLLEKEGEETDPGLVAYHYSRAGEAEMAVRSWLKAAQLSARRTAFSEAIASLNAALEDAALIADPALRSQLTLEAQLKLGQVYMSKSGPGTDEARAALAQAQALAKEMAPGPQLFQATWGLYLDAITRFESIKARALGEDLGAISDALADEDLQYEALHHRWGLAYFGGEAEALIQRSREGIERYDRERHHALSDVYAGHDPGVCAHCCQAFGLALQGRAAAARGALGDGLSLAESLQHPVTVTFALASYCHYIHMVGDLEACADFAERVIRVAERYEFRQPQAFARFLLGATRLQRGDVAAGFEQMSAAYPMAAAYRFPAGYQQVLMAEALMTLARPQDALDIVTRALEAMQEPEYGTFVPELWRVRGEATLRISPSAVAEAERCLAFAERVSRAKGARVHNARASLSLARLLARQGKSAEASAALARMLDGPPHEWNGPELAEARQLRASL